MITRPRRLEPLCGCCRPSARTQPAPSGPDSSRQVCSAQSSVIFKRDWRTPIRPHSELAPQVAVDDRRCDVSHADPMTASSLIYRLAATSAGWQSAPTPVGEVFTTTLRENTTYGASISLKSRQSSRCVLSLGEAAAMTCCVGRLSSEATINDISFDCRLRTPWQSRRTVSLTSSRPEYAICSRIQVN